MTDIRGFDRLEKDYTVEYGPFPSVLTDKAFKKGLLKNIGGGGILFLSEHCFDAGTQLVVKVFVSGWVLESGTAVLSQQHTDEMPLEAIVEVLRSDHDAATDRYLIGTKFVGRVHA